MHPGSGSFIADILCVRLLVFGLFLTFPTSASAKWSIMELKLNFWARSISMDIEANELSLFWPMAERRYLFMNLSLLNDLSAEATLTDKVRNNLDAKSTQAIIAARAI